MEMSYYLILVQEIDFVEMFILPQFAHEITEYHNMQFGTNPLRILLDMC